MAARRRGSRRLGHRRPLLQFAPRRPSLCLPPRPGYWQPPSRSAPRVLVKVWDAEANGHPARALRRAGWRQRAQHPAQGTLLRRAFVLGVLQLGREQNGSSGSGGPRSTFTLSAKAPKEMFGRTSPWSWCTASAQRGATTAHSWRPWRHSAARPMLWTCWGRAVAGLPSTPLGATPTGTQLERVSGGGVMPSGKNSGAEGSPLGSLPGWRRSTSSSSAS
mmetsp:Transcript_85683/g.245899  ORF Transcript_85683/g.245899 Transcript_85683/m.245899 type:complete len:219 (-) Transcript_85683:827-1483(-)